MEDNIDCHEVVITGKDELAEGIPIPVLLRLRKERRMGKRMGVSTSSLLCPFKKKSQKTKVTSSVSLCSYGYPEKKLASNDIKPPAHEILSKPQKVSVERQSYPSMSARDPPVNETPENHFFELSPERKITDEELYHEFKARYLAQGIERGYWRQRRFRCKRRLERNKKLNK